MVPLTPVTFTAMCLVRSELLSTYAADVAVVMFVQTEDAVAVEVARGDVQLTH